MNHHHKHPTLAIPRSHFAKRLFQYPKGFLPPNVNFPPANYSHYDVHDSNNGSTSVLDAGILPYTYGLTGVNLTLDHKFTAVLWISILSVIFLILLVRVWQLIGSHIRRLYCLTAIGNQQTYWKDNNSRVWPWLKKNLIYAPLGKKRHNRELQLSKAVNYGTLPGRLHSVLLLLYIASNAAFCLCLDYRHKSKAALLAELRGRSGILATVNLIPLIALAARNNPIIPLLKISFDTCNLLHRWIGRIVVLESLIHVVAWYVNYAAAKGHNNTSKAFVGNRFLQYGLVSMLAMALISIQSLSAIRHAFYETFLHLHQFFAFFAIAGLYFHLSVSNLPALPYVRFAILVWILERISRIIRIVYLNMSLHRGQTSLVVEALPGEACRLTFQLPRDVTIQPGSHVYTYIPSMSMWMSHPFSVAWTNLESDPPLGKGFDSHYQENTVPETPGTLEKQPSFPTVFPTSKAPTSISLIVAARTGITRSLYKRALNCGGKPLQIPGFVEGPYAGHDSMASYGTIIMFAGGAGITHHLIQIRHLLACSEARTVATRKITLVWSVRNVDALTWVRPWMDDILSMRGRHNILKILLYVTKPRGKGDYRSSHQTIQLNQGRCIPSAILDEELPSRIGATIVTVCGPGAFADEVRAAVRDRIHIGCIDMNEESFTW